MKELILTNRFVKITPRKARLVGNELKGLTLPQALDLINLIDRQVASIIKKMLIQAKHLIQEKNQDEKNFSIASFQADQGPALKRHWPRSRGRVSPIKKYTSHLKITFKYHGSKNQS